MDEKSIKKERKGRQQSNLVLANNLSPRNKTFQTEVLSSLSAYFVRNYAHIQDTFRIIRHSSPNNVVVVLGTYIMLFEGTLTFLSLVLILMVYGCSILKQHISYTHMTLNNTYNSYHQLHPFPFLSLRHTTIPLGSYIIKCLLKEIKIDSLSLFFSDEEVTLFKACGDCGYAPGIFACYFGCHCC